MSKKNKKERMGDIEKTMAFRPRITQSEWELIQQKRNSSEQNIPVINNKEFEYQENGENAWVEGYKITSLDQLLKVANVDLNLWEVEKYVINKWDVSMGARSAKTDKPTVRTNFQVKAWLKKKTCIIDYCKFKNELITDVKQYSPSFPKIVYNKRFESDDNCMLEPNIYDLHLGKLAWAVETGGENFDTKIATNLCLEAMNYLLTTSTSHFNISKILLTVGNDLFNSDKDYPFPQTTHGTPMESDLRWQKVFRIGRQLMFDIVAMCKTVAPVEIVVIPGNHESQKMFYLGEVLDAMYTNDPNVSVDNSPRSRKYKEFGKCLIGLTHGKDEKPEQLLRLMPQESKEAWARTMYREWHVGDKHHEKRIDAKSAEDFNGIVIRYMRTLMSGDSWESRLGFSGAIRGASAIVWNPEKGNIATFNYNRNGM